MKLLLLNGHGIDLRVDRAKLHIRDGRFSVGDVPVEYVFSPKRIDVDNVVIYGRDGNLTLDSIRWLVKHNVAVTFLNWNGKLMTIMLPPESVQVSTKFAQYHSYSDDRLRLEIAKKIIQAKFYRTQLVLDWLKQKYSVIDNDFSKEEILLVDAQSIPNIMMVEARVAGFYWTQLRKIIPKKFEFDNRNTRNRPAGAGDVINCLFNFGYAILESECLRAINAAGLDAHIGFLHEKCIGKNSLAYDFQEPYRFLIDLAVINLIENNQIEKSDFIRTENYNLRLRPTGAKKLIAEINKQFNKKVNYKRQVWSWCYILQDKTRELAHFLLGKKKKLNFIEPIVEHERTDSEELRQKILAIPYREWKRQGYSKGTLHYMKQNAQSNKLFTLNKHTKKLVQEIKI